MFNLETQKEMAEYQQTMLGHLNKIEKEYYSQWYFILRSQYRRASDAIKKDAFNKNKFFNAYAPETKNVLSRNIQAVYEKFATVAYDMYRSSGQSKASEDVSEANMAPWILTYAIVESNVITASTINMIEQTRVSGITGGLSSSEISDLVDSKWQATGQLRADRIVKTESHTTMGKTSLEVAKSISTRFRKIWVSTIDDRTRGNRSNDAFNHIVVNGQEKALTEPFIVSGEKMLFPGDPFASPANRVNCRCVTIFAGY